jgi:primosomal protein N' (replication factor Y)
MIADVVFDLPLDHPFSYRVPPDLSPRIRVGQRVRAPLQRRPRLGVVVALRKGVNDALEPILEPADPVVLLSPTLVELARRMASESLASWGSVCAALLPPPRPHHLSIKAVPGAKGNPSRPQPDPPILLIGGDREERLLDLLRGETHQPGFLLVAPEIEDAEAWARRLETALGWSPLRLHSGRPDGERYASWIRLAVGQDLAAVTTRAGLFAPTPAPVTLALVDEHDPAYKSPASPRLHARDVAEWRASVEGRRLLLTSATPSVESWWRAEDGQLQLVEGSPASWPEVRVVDLRENAPAGPFSDLLGATIGEALAQGGQVLLLAMRLGYAPVLICGECGFSPRCSNCRIGLAFRRQIRQLRCHLCRQEVRAPALCPRCRGRALTARGWGTERMEEAARAAFPRVPVVRYDGESARGVQGRTLGRLITRGEFRIVVGTRSALRLFPQGALGAVGVVSPDPLLHLPDFRAAERTFQLLWEAAERVGVRGGRLIVQTHYPDHYAITAVARQDRTTFYQNELKFRGELGYPPFSRLTRIVVRGKEKTRVEALAERISHDLVGLGASGLTIYGPMPLGLAARSRRWQLLVKGDRELPARLRPTLQPYLERRGSGGVTVEVDMDPMEFV